MIKFFNKQLMHQFHFGKYLEHKQIPKWENSPSTNKLLFLLQIIDAFIVKSTFWFIAKYFLKK